jgi:hypothetical protein
MDSKAVVFLHKDAQYSATCTNRPQPVVANAKRTHRIQEPLSPAANSDSIVAALMALPTCLHAARPESGRLVSSVQSDRFLSDSTIYHPLTWEKQTSP